MIRPPITRKPKTFQEGWILNGQRIWQQLKDVFPINHITTKLYGVGFILVHPHFPKLHIFRKPTVNKFFLVNGLGGIIPPYKAKMNKI
jgi:hypothetical protein